MELSDIPQELLDRFKYAECKQKVLDSEVDSAFVQRNLDSARWYLVSLKEGCSYPSLGPLDRAPSVSEQEAIVVMLEELKRLATLLESRIDNLEKA